MILQAQNLSTAPETATYRVGWLPGTCSLCGGGIVVPVLATMPTNWEMSCGLPADIATYPHRCTPLTREVE
jgi:hypothetical protein